MGGLLSPEPVLYEGRCSNRWTGRGLGWSRGRRPAKGSREARLRNAGRPCVCSNPRSCHRASDPRECESCVLSVCSPPGGDASPLHHQQGHGVWWEDPRAEGPARDLERGPFLRFNVGEHRSYIRPMDYRK